jgi:hypothetical protein
MVISNILPTGENPIAVNNIINNNNNNIAESTAV